MKYHKSKFKFPSPFAHYQRKQDLKRILVALAVGFGVLLAVALSFGYVYHSVNSTSSTYFNKIEKTLGTTVKIGKKSIGIDDITLYDIELVDMPKIKIELLRISFGFGKKNGFAAIKGIEIESSAIALNETELKKLTEKLLAHLNPEREIKQDPVESSKISSILLSAQQIRVRIQNLTVESKTAKNNIIVKDFNGRYTSESNMIDSSTGPIIVKNKDFGALKFVAYVSPSSGDLNFRLSKVSEDIQTPLTISGAFDKASNTGSVRGRLPTDILSQLSGLKFSNASRTDSGSPTFSANISKAEDAYKFALSSRIENVVIDDRRISIEPVGPLALNLSAEGQADIVSRYLKIEKSEALLSNKSDSTKQIKILGNAEVKWNSTYDVTDIQAIASMPETPCSSFTTIDPNHLTPNLRDFSTSGTVQVRASLNYQSKSKLEAQVNVDHFNFGCMLSANNPLQRREQLAKNQPLVSAFQKSSKYIPLFNPQTFVPIVNIPQRVVKIFLASEDISFYQHHGIDASSIASAFARNISTDRRLLGGSTISMQVAKNLFLSEERTASRKIQELFLTKYLEDNLSKQRILEIYFNIAEFGPGIYGIADAAKHLFDKDLADLNTLETTYLATLLPAPVKRYQYFCQNVLTPNMNQLVHQKLEMLHRLGRISDSEYSDSLNDQLSFSSENRKTTQHCPIPQQQAQR